MLESSELYAALAQAEHRPRRRELFRQISHDKKVKAAHLRRALTQAGGRPARFRSGFRTRLLASLASRFGPDFVLPTMAATEVARLSDTTLGASDIPARDTPTRPASAGESVLQTEVLRTGLSGNDLRAAVLGAIDGLVSNFCLVMGVAGAASSSKAMLVSGLAGLFAGASSMALGEWLSVSNARELAMGQVAKQRDAIARAPQTVQQRITLSLTGKGLPQVDAERAAAHIMQDPSAALDFTIKDMGIDPEELGGSPWKAAGLSFCMFAGGAAAPILPFAFPSGIWPAAASAIASVAGLGLVGAATSLFNGRTALYAASRQIVLGCMAAALTYGIGRLLGVSLAG